MAKANKYSYQKPENWAKGLTLQNAGNEAGERSEGRVALIIGGASDIGKETAYRFSKLGAQVIIFVGTEVTDKVIKEFKKIENVNCVKCDVTKENDFAKAIENVGKADIMVNNAEFLLDSTHSIDEYDMQPFQLAMQKVKKVMHGFKYAANLMKSNGCIISTACIAEITGQITPLAYTTSKHAVLGLTKSAAAKHVESEIRVNCVSSNGAGNSAHIADAVLYLASEETKYVRGHNLVVDGGFEAANHKWGLYCLQ